MFDGKRYELKYVQKSSPGKGDDFLFAEIYKFFTERKMKYIIRAEMHSCNTFAVKFYAARDRKLDNKYSRLTNCHKASRVFVTCSSVLPLLIEKYPTASFAINGSRTVDLKNDKIEGVFANQRFRIYRMIADALIGRETFVHYEFESVSSYLLVNRKGNSNPEKAKDDIKRMFINTYKFVDNI